ncbi:MAG TPA: fumarylacetoacetate hydrolase family protein [Azospirillaceae bacterium]|nr:fumarylacetoacetate hydrolase family protein [Azospirillaceae bacterium]
MASVIPVWSIPSVPVAGSADTFPVRRIYCVGRNYAAHAREMGADPTREPPFFFAKPADAVVPGGGRVPYPPATSSLHHEVELVVAIGKGGADIPADKALDHVYGYAVGLDLTRRDLQSEAKAAGKPWDMAKGFDQSAPISALHPAAAAGHPAKGTIRLTVNGDKRQEGDLSDQIWSVPEVIATLSRLVTLAPGDLIYTGTPDGVGPVKAGDRLDGSIEGLDTLTVTIG